MWVFEEVEATGSEITYRCPLCRICKVCKHKSTNEMISIKEEIEQSIINSTVKIDRQTATSTATLPFLIPLLVLQTIKTKQQKLYIKYENSIFQETKKTNKMSLNLKQSYNNWATSTIFETCHWSYNPNFKALKYYFITWRAVLKGSSISTPSQIVYDASQPTSTGFSLNDVLAKGRNNLNKLQEIFLRWSIHPFAITTDITKNYNTLCMSGKTTRYLWQKDLDVSKKPEEKRIKTLIYGVKSTQSQVAIKLDTSF